MIKINEDDEVIAGLLIQSDNDIIAVFSTKGYGKKVSIKGFNIQVRDGKGLLFINQVLYMAESLELLLFLIMILYY